MTDIKNIIIVLLLGAVGVLAYLLFVSFPATAEAECTAVVTEQVQGAVQQYEQTLQQLAQIPACAEALSQ